MTDAADNEELDALVALLHDVSWPRNRLGDKAADAITALRASVAEAERLTEAALAAQESTTELLRAAESQLQQVKADAERWRAMRELLLAVDWQYGDPPESVCVFKLVSGVVMAGPTGADAMAGAAIESRRDDGTA